MALRAIRTETPGWLIDDALLEALDVLVGRIVVDLLIADRDAA